MAPNAMNPAANVQSGRNRRCRSRAGKAATSVGRNWSGPFCTILIPVSTKSQTRQESSPSPRSSGVGSEPKGRRERGWAVISEIRASLPQQISLFTAQPLRIGLSKFHYSRPNPFGSAQDWLRISVSSAICTFIAQTPVAFAPSSKRTGLPRITSPGSSGVRIARK